VAYSNIQSDTGSFVPTTNIWDVNHIYETDINTPEFKELLVRLYQNMNNIALVLNTKSSGYYINKEFVTGKLYYNPTSNDPMQLRPGYAITIPCGALGVGPNTPVAHGLTVTNTWQWMSIYGAATDSVNLYGYPITFGGTVTGNIAVYVDSTNINIDNQTGVTFTSSAVTLEYVKF